MCGDSWKEIRSFNLNSRKRPDNHIREEESMQIPQLPFNILVLAPFCPTPATGWKPELINVDLSGMDEAMAALGPNFIVPVEKELCPEAGLTLRITRYQGFKPEKLIQEIPYLQRINEAARFVAEQRGSGATAASITARLQADWPELPLDYSVDQDAHGAPSGEIDDILSMIAMPGGSSTAQTKVSKDLTSQLDRLLSELMGAVYRNDQFRTYESAWRGLEVLLKQGGVKEGQGVRLTVTAVSEDNLAEALEQLMILQANDPPNLVLIDLPFDSSARSTELLTKVCEFSETLLAPTVCWAGSRLFYLDDWQGLKKIQYLKHHLEDAAYAKWRKLKDLSGANWVTMAINRFMVRTPYGPEHQAKGVSFEETTPLWISPVWAIGTLTVQSLKEFGWPSRFTDYAHLTLKELPTLNTHREGPGSAEMLIDENRIGEFLEIGLTPLLGPVRKDFVIAPKETTLSGGSLKFQLFTSRVLQFLFWAQENLSSDINGTDIAAGLTAAFARYWERTGHQPPEDLKISAGNTTVNDRIPLTITMTPPTSVLPGGHRLEFTFSW
jgi:predicted component of type VI protein secretion system